MDGIGPLILYVEDEPAISELAEVALEDAGYAVVGLASAAEAIAILDARAADFAALVTDVDLRSELTGWDVARHAREIAPSLPIIYVSGGSAGDWSSQGVPGSVMLAKPYALAQLVVAVSTATVEGGGPGSLSN
ncbi:response regulator [Phenylobacterium sp.]|uniref:response regulator n=1 Tax=Phenylobacterium sp. TaxID=1871053 RepID=UPI001225FFCA|nr:response regulator [Phenylobacterium sp.]THD59290.1 MAG: response regulator [Phenylobacterium sp.]